MSVDVKEQINEALKLHQQGNLADAEKLYSQILKESPNEGNVLNLLGFLKIQNNQFQDAIEYLKKAAEIYPTFFDAWFNLGLAYKSNKEFAKSLEAYEKAASIKADNPYIYFNMANIYEAYLNDTFKAIEYYEKALKYKNDEKDTDINYFLGMCYLKAKDFEKGLIQHEYRPSKPLAIFSQSREYKLIEKTPLWDGKEMKDKTLFVYYESALGDTLLYVRYLDLVKNMFKKVLFKPQPCFEDFFKENNFGTEIIGRKTLPQDVIFDVHIPLMSIPYVLNSKEIPLSEGYLKANKEKVKEYKQKYFNNNKFKIGIKWMGNPDNDLTRAITTESFYKLFELPNTQFYSVQKGDGIEEFEKIPKHYNVINLGETFKDFSDTAAAIENMDLVICNDTSVAHLVGAMGKPCWILLPYVQNWRWCMDINYSPWYKSVKLFKQTNPGNWDEVFNEVSNALSHLVT